MSDYITSDRLDEIVQKNKAIKKEIDNKVNAFYQGPFYRCNHSFPQLGLDLLKERGLIQLPIDDNFWNGAIFVQEGKIIPVINTAQIRANQYFTIWHEIYHLIIEKIETTHSISIFGSMQERQADCFAARVLLNNIESYYSNLAEDSFEDKIYCCMDYFQVPYKAVLISLYEFADATNNPNLKDQIKAVFDKPTRDFTKEFQRLGLDDSLVKPSNVINVSYLENMINDKIKEEPDKEYHQDSKQFFESIMAKIKGNNR